MSMPIGPSWPDERDINPPAIIRVSQRGRLAVVLESPAWCTANNAPCTYHCTQYGILDSERIPTWGRIPHVAFGCSPVASYGEDWYLHFACKRPRAEVARERQVLRAVLAACLASE